MSILFCVPVDAVYAAAHAIHDIIADNCGTNPFHLCEDLKPAPMGTHLLKYLRNVSFIGKFGVLEIFVENFS